MKRRNSKRRHNGQALVEFALVSPVLFAIILGIIEAGRLILYTSMLNNAAREGGRYAIVHGANALDGCPSGPVPFGVSSCDAGGDRVKARIVEAASPLSVSGISYDSPFPVYTWPDGSSSPSPTDAVGNNVTVRISYTYTPLLLVEVFGSIQIQAETTLVINN